MNYPAVYSYKRSGTRELELSIESLKNIDCWNGEIIIVGDDPNLDIEYKHFHIKYEWGRRTGIRWNDEICAYLTAADLYDDFIAMADDLFILQPWKLSKHHRGESIDHIKGRRYDKYSRQLERTQRFLEANNKPTLSYELHIPFLINSKQLKEVEPLIPHNSQSINIRTVLGNWFENTGMFMDDVKNKQLTKDTVLYSSSNDSFNYDKVKEFLWH